MSYTTDLTVKDTRYLNKFYLDNFVFDKVNILDNPVDKLIKDKKKEILSNREKIDLAQEDCNNPNLSIVDNIRLQTELHHLELDQIGVKDELLALFEVKIIYAYKTLEINIKNLLVNFYEDKTISKIYQWDRLVEYFKLKNINIKNISGYNEADQLRIVNNYFKHSGNSIDSALKSITEFKNKEYLTFSECELFYNRVSASLTIFLTSLVKEINKDLYEFSANKISDLARQLALRMEKKEATELSEILLSYYE